MREENWLLLSQYSQKYNVSVSTVRRYLKKGKIEHKLVDNKYLIKDAPMPGAASAGDVSHMGTAQALKEILEFCQNLIKEKEKIYQDIIRDKTREIMNYKERVAEQKMLINIIEDKLLSLEGRQTCDQASEADH